MDVQGLATATRIEELKLQNAVDISSVRDLGDHRALVNLTLINLPSLQSLAGVTAMSLRALHIGRAPRLENIQEVRDCGSLVRLTLDDTAATDLAVLDGHATLSQLRVANQGLVQLSTLAELPQLKVIELDGVAGELDLSWLAIAERVERIVIRNTEDEITFATFEHRLKPLRRLELRSTGVSGIELRDVKGISELIFCDSRVRKVDLATAEVGEVVIQRCAAEILTLPAGLSRLTIDGCPRLRRVEVEDGFARLEEIAITMCESLNELPPLKGGAQPDRVVLERLGTAFDGLTQGA